jgi:hypothetical protein
MIVVFRRGFSAAWRNWGLAALVLALNLGVAALLAAPLAGMLEQELRGREAGANMLYGFDQDWWSRWSDAQSGWTRSFGPELAGSTFLYRNLDLLLRGHLPARLFDRDEPGGADPLDGVILGLGLAYLLLQVFLSGGILGVLREPHGGWKLRGLIHGSGFYFGRMFRLALLTLALYGLVFALNGPFARWADHRAYDAVSENAALAWMFGRRVVLLLALGAVFLLSSYAKAIVVIEERASALLALLSSLGFCLRNGGRVLGHALLVLACGVALVAAWSAFDAAWTTSGYKTQLVALLAGQLLMFGRIFLRLALLGGQVALCQVSSPTGR